MTKDELILAFEKAKVLKSDIIFISYGKILGVNTDYCILQEYDSDVCFPFEVLYLNKDMSKFIKYIKDNYCDDELICTNDKIIYQDMSIFINNSYALYKIKDMYNIFNHNCTKDKLVKYIDNLNSLIEDNPFTKKTSDKSILKLDQYISIVYGKMIPVNKSDKISLEIYSVNEEISMYKYYIDKKKKGILNVYMVCINLC